MFALCGGPDGAGSVKGRRVVITGVGVVSSCGIGADNFWQGLLADAPLGRERPVKDLDVSELFGPKEIRRTDRFVQLAAGAADEAVRDAGGVEAFRGDPDRAGSYIGTGVGGLDTIIEQDRVLIDKGPGRVSPFLVPMIMCNRAAADVSMRYGLRGPCETTVTACAAGSQSIANAARLIATGRCDVMLAGSSEAPLSELGISGFSNMTALTKSGVSMPFDTKRDGFVIGEGAAVVVLEERERAIGRGARIYAEIAGAASTADAHHITAPEPAGAGAARCMELAIADAGISPSEIAHVNAHGTSTPPGDAAEAEAVAKVFGQGGPPVTSIKGVLGHTLAAAGAIEAVAVVLSMAHRLIPPTTGTTEVDPAFQIDLVTGSPRPWEPGPVVSNSFGFGGHNGCLVITPHAA
ncbi:MAG TPA: beta-ketoacyl-[acyl-carrier-protein] synthase family protein [Acidimicrobiales bacterium]|nr:beta-ketoacyl-[acyl-carrier-protein] synthase family protein [Acidimicrobiales bacterium]